MPFYSFDLVIPAGTAEATPAQATAQLGVGIITSLRLVIPPGVAGLAFTRVRRGGAVLWPTNAAASLTGDGDIIAWAEEYPLLDEPLALTLDGFSPTARFAHTLTWRFEMEPLTPEDEVQGARGLIRRLAGALLGED